MTIHLDKKSVAIGILSFTAALLVAANFCWTPRAQAETVKGDQYIAVTGRIAAGGDALYLTNRDGVMAVFVYNPNKKAVEPRAVRSVVNAFNGAGADLDAVPAGHRMFRPFQECKPIPPTLFLETDMKTKVFWALIALNVLLLAGLLSPLGHGTAQAQVPGPAAHAGDHFLMISGEATGANGALVYLIDENTNQLSARLFTNNVNGGTFDDMPPISLDRVFEAH